MPKICAPLTKKALSQESWDRSTLGIPRVSALQRKLLRSIATRAAFAPRPRPKFEQRPLRERQPIRGSPGAREDASVGPKPLGSCGQLSNVVDWQ